MPLSTARQFYKYLNGALLVEGIKLFRAHAVIRGRYGCIPVPYARHKSTTHYRKLLCLSDSICLLAHTWQ